MNSENNEKNAEKKQKKEQEKAKMIFSISVMENGLIYVVENDEIIQGVTAIEFSAKVNEVPSVRIEKNIHTAK